MELNWTLRKALPADADQVAAHGQYREEHALHRPRYAAWARPRIETGSYVGWLAVAEGAVIAGAGAVLLDWGPTRSNPCGQMARIVNVFTDKAWRSRGIARALLEAVLRDCEAKGIGEFNLASTPEARSLYASLGFDAYPAEMRRRIDAC